MSDQTAPGRVKHFKTCNKDVDHELIGSMVFQRTAKASWLGMCQKIHTHSQH